MEEGLYKNLYMGFYDRSMHDHPKLEESRCSVGEWINELWDTQIMDYHSALKRNEISSHNKI